MHKLLERLDNAASQIVPLLCLLGLALGAASYFAGVMLGAGLAVGFALAIAAELHSFLQQRPPPTGQLCAAHPPRVRAR